MVVCKSYTGKRSRGVENSGDRVQLQVGWLEKSLSKKGKFEQRLNRSEWVSHETVRGRAFQAEGTASRAWHVWGRGQRSMWREQNESKRWGQRGKVDEFGSLQGKTVDSYRPLEGLWHLFLVRWGAERQYYLGFNRHALNALNVANKLQEPRTEAGRPVKRPCCCCF